MNIKVITPPVKLPVSIAEIKEHLRIEIADDDRDIELKIRAVVASLDPPDGRLGRAMITQTLRLSLSPGLGSLIRLPYPPVQSIDSVSYLNSLDVETEISNSIYAFKNDQEPAFVVLKTGEQWPTDYSYNDPYPFKINFISGYGDNADSVPEYIRLGIMMEVGDLYLQRENIIIGQTLGHNEFTRRIFDNYIWRN